tara:strand:- start:15542 stop:16165 length:624 start_codon:yes stop_codon:yes gene_type:complete
MAIVLTDINDDLTISSISGSLMREERILDLSYEFDPTPGSKVITFNESFSSAFTPGDVLRISDGVTTIDYTLADTSSGTSPFNAASATQIGTGGDRAATLAVDEFVSKINSSALDITAADNGGGDRQASFTLTPGSGKTITVTEDPSGDGNFGSSAALTTVTTTLTTKTPSVRAAPFRVFIKGAPNLRGQTADAGKHYKTFVGRHIT